MRVFIILIALFFTSMAVNAANIISYETKEKGETVFLVVNSKTVFAVKYIEDERELRVYINKGGKTERHAYIVNTPNEALGITNKLFDDSDKSLIELVRD